MDGSQAKFNHYKCDTCGRTTVAMHEDPGTTPFIIRCHATKDCEGAAQSLLYRGPQDPDQRVHIIWFRPLLREAAIAAIAKSIVNKRVAAMMIEHWAKGGCLMRPAPEFDRATCKHMNFSASVNVGRIGVVNGVVERYNAEVTVQCADCDEPFVFVGLTPAIDLDRPVTSIDSTKAHLPIEPKGQNRQLPAEFRVTVPPAKPTTH